MNTRTLVIIPTYNEQENIHGIVPAVLGQDASVEVLVVDDGSPDGTGDIVAAMGKANPRVHLLRRAGKQGLGTAYIAGFKWGLAQGFDYLMEMDADFSHDPKEIPNFLTAIGTADLVLGSRYTNGIRVMNWPMSRLMLSKGASWYVRLITGLPVMDPTGGFKCFRRAVLAALDLERVRSNGYAERVPRGRNSNHVCGPVCRPFENVQSHRARSALDGLVNGRATRLPAPAERQVVTGHGA